MASTLFLFRRTRSESRNIFDLSIVDKSNIPAGDEQRCLQRGAREFSPAPLRCVSSGVDGGTICQTSGAVGVVTASTPIAPHHGIQMQLKVAWWKESNQ